MHATNQRRQPAGAPTGGQFATADRPEVGTALHEPVPADVLALDPREHLRDLARRVTAAELDAVADRLGRLRHHSLDDTVTTAAQGFAVEHRDEGELVLRRLADQPSEYSLATGLAYRVSTARLVVHGRR